MENKQTAVKWLIEQINPDFKLEGTIQINKISLDMEQDQLKKAFISGIMLGSGAFQCKKEFDADIEFENFLKIYFPER